MKYKAEELLSRSNLLKASWKNLLLWNSTTAQFKKQFNSKSLKLKNLANQFETNVLNTIITCLVLLPPVHVSASVFEL